LISPALEPAGRVDINLTAAVAIILLFNIELFAYSLYLLKISGIKTIQNQD
jgi:hypothetical protein